MATAGNGYENGGAGGKSRKRPFRRNVQAKPYDRPPIPLRNNNPSLLTKLVDPASRLIYAGAHRLFGAFRKRLPSLSLQGPPEVNVEPQNVPQETGQIGNSATNSAASEISELEQMFQQKTFTSSEIQRLTALLHSRTTESPSDVVERDEAKPYNSPSSFLRIEPSTSGSLKKRPSVSTPIVSSKVFEEEIASPAELAKAYMGYRPTPTKAAPSPLRQDLKLLNNATGPPRTPITSMGPKTADSWTGQENGFVTPRSRGRSAMYNMARTPYARSPSSFTQKLIGSSYGHDTSSRSGFGHEGNMGLKRRSSVLDEDIGSGGPLRRTRQKANLLSQREKRELGYTTLQQPETSNQKLLLTNGPEPSIHGSGLGSGSGYASVPTKSTQTATKILQHLEKLSPKEKEFGSATKQPNKLTLDMLQGQALRSLEKVDSPKLLNYPRDIQKPEVVSKGKEKVEENGFKKFPSPRNMLTSVNGESSVTVKDNPPIVEITDTPLRNQAEAPQKKRAFQMSVTDDSFEIDDDEIHVNGNVSFPLVEHNKPETVVVTNKPAVADIIKTTKVPEVSGTPAFVENNKPKSPEVVKSPEQPPELKEAENAKKTDSDQGFGFKLPTSSSPVTSTQTENGDLKKISTSFSVGKSMSPFSFSANMRSEVKPNTSSDPKAVVSTSVFTSFTKTDEAKDKIENGNDEKTTNIFGKIDSVSNGNDQKPANIFAKSESVPSPVPAATSASGGFMFGTPTNNSTTPKATPVTTAPTFPSFTSFPASTAASTPAAISTTTTTAASSLFSTSVPAPVFSFGSAISTSTTTSTTVAENGNGNNTTNEKEPKSVITNSPFAITSFPTNTTSTTAATGSSPFGFSSPAATSTTTAATGSGVFSFSSPAATSTTTAATGSGVFGFSAPVATSTTTAASGSSHFGFSAPAATSTTTAATGSSPFGFSSPAATSTTSNQSQTSLFNITNGSQATTTQAATFQFGSTEVKSTSGPASSVFGATWPAPQSSGFGSSSVFSFGASSTSTPSATTSPAIFSSFVTAGTTNSTFATPTQPQQPMFGNPTPAFGISPNNNNNDRMSMEDSMAEDSMQTPGPVSPFGQPPAQTQTPTFGQPPAQTQTPVASPGFMFGSATPTPAQAPVGFQFGGQPSQPAAPQNPFQSSSVEFNGGGSFSLGSGGDKSGRRIVRVKKQNRRK